MLQKDSMSLTLEVFFLEPSKEHYLMDISRKTNIAHPSIKKNLSVLLKSKIIKKEIQKKGSRKFPIFKALIDNKEFKTLKMIYNIKSIYKSGLSNFLKGELFPKCIILFGSYRRGEDFEDSDIDIFIECKEEKLDLTHFEKILKRKIQLHFKNNFSDYSKELKNNIINGIVFEGFLEGYL